MKRIVSIFILVFISTSIFAQSKKTEPFELDIDYRFYLPSFKNIVSGNNPIFGLRENYEIVTKCNTFLCEGRVSIIKLKSSILSLSLGTGNYFEFEPNDGNSSMNLTLGVGCYFPTNDKFLLSGLCFYLYPMYQVPIYVEGKSYFKWSSAFDIGYNLVLLDCITIYPFGRAMISWNASDYRFAFDCGFAVGFYFDG